LSGGGRSFRLEATRFELAAGDVVALVGESGSGKTAMLELLGLAAAPDQGGRFALEGGSPADLAALWARGRLAALARLRAQHFGFVSQTGGLLPYLDIRANAALAQEVAGRPDQARLSRLEARLGLSAIARQRPGRLSLGQRQRAAVLRALAHQPAFVVADEPTAALDPAASETVMRLLLETAADEGAAVVVSSHDVALMDRVGASIVPVVPGPAEAGGEAWVSRVEREA
jgi:putative ABC transport system ATP-binding protein